MAMVGTAVPALTVFFGADTTEVVSDEGAVLAAITVSSEPEGLAVTFVVPVDRPVRFDTKLVTLSATLDTVVLNALNSSTSSAISRSLSSEPEAEEVSVVVSAALESFATA